MTQIDLRPGHCFDKPSSKAQRDANLSRLVHRYERPTSNQRRAASRKQRQ